MQLSAAVLFPYQTKRNNKGSRQQHADLLERPVIEWVMGIHRDRSVYVLGQEVVFVYIYAMRGFEKIGK